MATGGGGWWQKGQEAVFHNEIFIYSTHSLDPLRRACMWKPIKCLGEINAPDKNAALLPSSPKALIYDTRGLMSAGKQIEGVRSSDYVRACGD